jgi:hypothetical protein
MELEEIKNIWDDYDRRLDKNLKLNIQLLRRMNFDKANFRMRWLLAAKIVEMCWLFFLVVYLANFAAGHFREPQFSIPAIMLGIACIAYFAYDIVQLSLIIQLQLKENELPISALQKMIGRLKFTIVTQFKCSLFLFPFYPGIMILLGKIFMNVDFFSPHHHNYLFSNIAIGLVLLPGVIWAYIQLGKKETDKKWIRKILAGSGWHLANDAGAYLAEITEFEKED